MSKFYFAITLVLTITLGILFALDAPGELYLFDLLIMLAIIICYPLGLDEV